MTRLPRGARWGLRLTPVRRDERSAVEADLRELFDERRRERGAAYAHWRLYRDVASLRRAKPAASDGAASGARVSLVSDAWIDLRYAARLFARQPAILLLTVAGLSLGLAVATSAFSIMNAAALRGEGLVDPDRAPGVLRIEGNAVSTAWRYDEFRHLRDGATRMQIEGVLTGTAQVQTIAADAEAPSTAVAFVSGGFFAATGARIIAGRPLEAADDERAGPPPVVVSFVFWTSRLNQDPQAMGRTIRIGRADATIVGIAAREFAVPGNRRLWLPLNAYGAVYDPGAIGGAPETGIEVFGRLMPGVSLAEAEAQLSGVAAALPAEAGQLAARLDRHAGLGRASGADALAIGLVVFAGIGLVLLLACANVATILLSTAIAREREMGMRAALGAGRGRLIRQLVTESLALGAAAAIIGLTLAWWAIPLIGSMIEAPPGTDLAPDFTVFLFLALATLVTSLAAGLAPAWHGRGRDLLTALKGGEGGQQRVAPRRLRSMLVVTQAAVSVILIVISTLFARATVRAANIDVGFDAAGLYAVSPGLGDPFAGNGAANMDFLMRAAPEVLAIPGIASATAAELTPFSGIARTSMTREEPSRAVNLNATDANYFTTMGLRTLAGRTYTNGEVASAAPVAVISESLARAYWPGRSPLGEMLPERIPMASTRPVVIGVVTDAIAARVHERGTLAIYEPLGGEAARFAQLLVRVAPGTTGAVDQASQRLRALHPHADVRFESIAARLRQETGRPRMLATLTGIVGVIAIVLCVLGLYGLTASLVGQRSREMAVRAAIGAEPRDLLRLLMWDSLRPVVVGVSAGAGAAFLTGRLVEAAVFFGVPASDPVAFAGAAATLLTAAVLAVLVPTRRAASVDAAQVLRRP